MPNSIVTNPNGILHPAAGEKNFQLTRYAPAPDLAFFVERYWMVRWDLRGQAPYLSENLPYPCVNLVVEPNQSRVYGVVRRKFSYLLEGQGRVFGIKFRPGAFYPFVEWPISRLTDRSLPLAEVFGPAGRELETAILSQPEAGPTRLIELAEEFLQSRLPAHDETVDLINRIVDQISADRTIVKVADLLPHLALSQRSLQRLFNQYVGVSPKWVIRRTRLQEAADQLATGPAVDWPQLALALGYFDQAHFIKDFKAIVGQSPAAYARTVG